MAEGATPWGTSSLESNGLARETQIIPRVCEGCLANFVASDDFEQLGILKECFYENHAV